MSANLEGGDKKSVNIELNIVPFIDLMSCLTAFLLATAVWVNIARIDIRPKGKTLAQTLVQEPEDRVILSVLIQQGRIWTCTSRDGACTDILRKAGGDQDWDQYLVALKAYKESGDFVGRTDIEIAAESTKTDPVNYKEVIRAMDLALEAGFTDVGLSDPQGLAARPIQ